MRVEIFIQARMGSTRLPGKVMMPVLDKPLLEYQLERLARVRGVDGIVVLTTNHPHEEPIVRLAEKCKVHCIRGPEEHVLERFHLAAKQRKVDAIVRSTADCPLIDPTLIDTVITTFKEAAPDIDYVSNTIERTYPRGMCTEIFSMRALEYTYEHARTKEDHEHVTLFMYQHPRLFRLKNVRGNENLSNLRLTVDTQEDFMLIEHILKELYPQKPDFSLDDIVRVLKAHPEWLTINAHIEQKRV